MLLSFCEHRREEKRRCKTNNVYGKWNLISDNSNHMLRFIRVLQQPRGFVRNRHGYGAIVALGLLLRPAISVSAGKAAKDILCADLSAVS